MPAPKLDSRASRDNLTSRECAKIFGIGVSMLRNEGHSDLDIRYATVIMARVLIGRTDLVTGEEDVDRVALNSLSALVSGMSDMAPQESITTAVQWWAETDGAWEVEKLTEDQVRRFLGERSGLN